ncbi:hypothetical protein RND81_14G103500 [Saponaria officinalis]|uniref:Uncharacterized protein n=1 Tax=Saponaria officinalis TaxID=3572 RepID=A0AAW1GQM3_SAPOF
MICFLSTVNGIWEVRNDVAHKNKVFNPVGKMKKIEEGIRVACEKQQVLRNRSNSTNARKSQLKALTPTLPPSNWSLTRPHTLLEKVGVVPCPLSRLMQPGVLDQGP